MQTIQDIVLLVVVVKDLTEKLPSQGSFDIGTSSSFGLLDGWKYIQKFQKCNPFFNLPSPKH